ncbi:IS1380 family transposase [Marinilabiliaceae bacterium JC017]|nr:IS1380 family transposase [Marinilabiliaceae bacterium JC017]
MVKNNFEKSHVQAELFPVKSKNIELSFTGETLSSNGGLLLLRGVDTQLGLISKIGACIKDKRDLRYIDHTVQELLTQRIFQISAGYEDGNDCSELRSDLAVKICAGRLPESDKDLASQPTMSRLENMMTNRDLYNMGDEIVNHFIQSYASAPKMIILDCDDTNHNTHGEQQLSLYNHYYREHYYMPLHIYEGLSGKLITTILKPGRRSKQAHVGNLLKKLIGKLRAYWPNTFIIIRGDGHFASHTLMDWCNSESNVGFITGLSGNKTLNKMAQITINGAEKEFKDREVLLVKRYHTFFYKAESWEHAQRVIVKVEVSTKGTNVRYIVTNIKGFRTRSLYEKGYCARGAMELRIKEHKLYLKSDRSSCSQFKANQFRLFLHSIAYILMHTMQKELFKGTEFENATLKTIQNKIIKTAVWVKELKTKVKIELPKACPTKALQLRSFQLLEHLQST